MLRRHTSKRSDGETNNNVMHSQDSSGFSPGALGHIGAKPAN